MFAAHVTCLQFSTEWAIYKYTWSRALFKTTHVAAQHYMSRTIWIWRCQFSVNGLDQIVHQHVYADCILYSLIARRVSAQPSSEV